MASKPFSHATIERNVTILAVLALLVVTIGGIVEIAPLFWIDSTIREISVAIAVTWVLATRFTGAGRVADHRRDSLAPAQGAFSQRN